MRAGHKHLLFAGFMIILSASVLLTYRYYQNKIWEDFLAEADKVENQPWYICLKQQADASPQKIVRANIFSYYQADFIKTLASSSLYTISEITVPDEMSLTPPAMSLEDFVEFSARCDKLITEQKDKLPTDPTYKENQLAIDACWKTLREQSNPVAFNAPGYIAVSSTLKNLTLLGLDKKNINKIRIDECAGVY